MEVKILILRYEKLKCVFSVSFFVRVSTKEIMVICDQKIYQFEFLTIIHTKVTPLRNHMVSWTESFVLYLLFLECVIATIYLSRYAYATGYANTYLLLNYLKHEVLIWTEDTNIQWRTQWWNLTIPWTCSSNYDEDATEEIKVPDHEYSVSHEVSKLIKMRSGNIVPTFPVSKANR